ncbi:MAG: hypothetical protein PHI98_06130 [Eubacteriales bacterium]|nr:hypothetical protein [Eubacteriales bacterium]
MTLQKILALAVALVMTLALPLLAFAEDAALDTELEGYVTELVEGGFLMEDIELGQVMLNVDDQTVLDGVVVEEGIQVGQYVIVAYDGRLTRSLPPQAHADKVGCYVLRGTVGDFLDDGMLLLDDEIFGDVIVHIGGSFKPIYSGVPVTVYYDGVMAMSLPGQVTAREIEVPELSGTISNLSDEGFTLTDEDGVAYEVLMTDETLVGRLGLADGSLADGDPADGGLADGSLADGDPADGGLADGSLADGSLADGSSEDGGSAEDQPSDGAEAGKGSEEMSAEPSQEPEGTDESDVETDEEGEEDSEMIVEEYLLQEGDSVTVYYDGTMTKSVPAQITALEVLAQQ